MNCPHCGSTAVQPSGVCSGCGRSVNTPAGAPSDPTALHYPPPVDPYSSAPLTGHDPLAPYTPPPEHHAPPPQPTAAQREPDRPAGSVQPAPVQPAPAQWPSSPQPYASQPYEGQPYGSHPYPAPGYGPPPYGFVTDAQPQSTGQGFTITAYVLAAIAVFILPIVLGPAAILFAAAARRRGEPQARMAMRLAVAGMVVGFLLGYLVRLSS